MPFDRLAMLAVLVVAGITHSAFSAEAGRPNIVLILADDMGYGDLGCYNRESKIPTPNMDRLAGQGMRWTDMHTPSSVCTPTRYGLLTGRYCWRTKLTRGVLVGYSPLLIEPRRMTLASLLKGKGYHTACVGKWHLGLGTQQPADFSKRLSPGPNTVGFDESFILPASLDMPPYVFVENERVTEPPTTTIAASRMRREGGGGFWREGAIAPSFKHVDVLPAFTAKAIDVIRKQTAEPQKPFFLYLPLAAPHTPWMPTDEFRGKSQADYYGDFVMQVDASIGKVLAALDEKKLADNTLVIVTSDNGAHWLPSDIEKWTHRANGSLRGQKADLWDGGHRVPFIARWPGKIKANTTSDELACLTDMLSTVAAVVGETLPADAGEDSFNLLPALLGEKLQRPIREAVVHHSADGTFAIRQGPWKLAMALGSHGFSDPKDEKPAPDGPRGQLYRMQEDPAESKNLWLEKPQVVAQLTALLAKYQQEGRSRVAVTQAAVTQAPFPGKKTAWNGYDRYDFTVDGKPVLVVVPKQAAEGKPWVWHGEFFGHKPAPDIALLGKGFHIVYMSVPNMLGCPDAVEHWNACYKELTTKHGFSKKAALVGLSRGGLYVYNWAAANPERVACIYADAAVCDFKSWPGGKGKGKGSPGDWKLILDRYHFKTEAEALAYDKNPIDNLQPLATAKVSLLHVYGDADDVVPHLENTAIIAERYSKLGGDITLIAKPGVGHHPHGLEDSTPIVEFIVKHSK